MDRDPYFKDPRIHCVLYFIAPSGHALTPLDIKAMKAISKVANLIPIIGKADCMTNSEKDAFKRRIREEIEFHEIEVYPNFLLNDPKTLEPEDRKIVETVMVYILFYYRGCYPLLSSDLKEM